MNWSSHKHALKPHHPSFSQSVMAQQAVGAVGYTAGTNDEGSLEYALAKKEEPTYNANSNKKILDKTSVDSLEVCLVLFSLFQRQIFWVFISMEVNIKMHLVVANRFGTDACLSPVTSSFLQPNWLEHVKLSRQLWWKLEREKQYLYKVSSSNTFLSETSTHVHDFLSFKSFPLDLLSLGTLFIDRCFGGMLPTEWKIVPMQSGPLLILTFLRLIQIPYRSSTSKTKCMRSYNGRNPWSISSVV